MVQDGRGGYGLSEHKRKVDAGGHAQAGGSSMVSGTSARQRISGRAPAEDSNGMNESHMSNHPPITTTIHTEPTTT